MKKYICLLVIVFSAFTNINAEEVCLIINGCKLKGTLEIPKSDKNIDVALLIPGSGPTDRDGNSGPKVKNNSLKMIANLLLNNGVASLRYDKRSVGESDKIKEDDLTIDTFVNDAVEWIKFLKKDSRFNKIIIIGHSEGSLVGILAAEKITINKFVSLCGLGEPANIVIERQLGNNSKMPQAMLDKCHTLLDSLKEGYRVYNYDPSLRSIFRESVQPFLISWFKFDPAKEIVKLSIPILVVGGTNDLQVRTEDAKILNNSNKKSVLKIIDSMNHVLKNVKTNDVLANLKSYNDPELPLSEDFSKCLIDFLKEE